MSFSVETTQGAEDIRRAIDMTEVPAHVGPGNLRLLRYGKAIAVAILDSGEVGDAGDAESDETPATAFRVSISGHAAAESATVGDVLMVSVNQVPFESAPPTPDSEPEVDPPAEPAAPTLDEPPAVDPAPDPGTNGEPDAPVPPAPDDPNWRDEASGHPV